MFTNIGAVYVRMYVWVCLLSFQVEPLCAIGPPIQCITEASAESNRICTVVFGDNGAKLFWGSTGSSGNDEACFFLNLFFCTRNLALGIYSVL